MLYKKGNPWFSSALSVSTSNQQIPHRQREHQNTFSTEVLNSPYEVAAGILLYRYGIFTVGNITASIYSQKSVLKRPSLSISVGIVQGVKQI
jgi:hypothetical protein